VAGATLEGYVRADVAEDPLPDVAVSVDEAGHDDHSPGVDDLCLVDGEVGPHLANDIALDENVGGCEVADLAVEGEDRAPLDQEPLGRLDAEVDAFRVDGRDRGLHHLAASEDDPAGAGVVALYEFLQGPGLEKDDADQHEDTEDHRAVGRG